MLRLPQYPATSCARTQNRDERVGRNSLALELQFLKRPRSSSSGSLSSRPTATVALGPSTVRCTNWYSSRRMSLRRRHQSNLSPVPPEPQQMSKSADAFSSRDPYAQRNSEAQESFSAAVVNAAIVLPCVAWLVTLLAGAASYDGPSRATDAHLPLAWYDAIFVRFGPLLPLAPLALRFLADRTDEPSIPSPGRALLVYVIVSFVRLAVYLAGVAFGSAAMSDHLFLGATVVVSAQGEATACAASLVRLLTDVKWTQRSMRCASGVVRGRAALPGLLASACVAGAGLATAVALVLLQCGDAYYTAAYFHAPRETAIGAVSGLVLCQSVVFVGVVLPASRDLGRALLST